MRHTRYVAVSILAMAIAVLSTARFTSAVEQHAVSKHSDMHSNSQLIFESSKLVGMGVYNRQSQEDVKLGKVDNLIVQAPTGEILYGIVDTGLIAGKLIPVPWHALRLYKTTDKDEYWFALNKTKDELANAPTFDKNHWPDFTSSDWKKSVDTFFGTPERQQSAQSSRIASNEMIFQSSHLADLDVFNRGDTEHKLGNLDNLLVEVTHGQVLYGILDTGAGGKNIAVPWMAFAIQKAADKDQYWLLLNTTKDELANAPSFDKNHLPNVADMKWQQEMDRFFGVQTARRTDQR
jgi:hypothetical protein